MKGKMIIFKAKTKTTMIALTGTYYDGRLELDEPVVTDKPIKVIVTFLEEAKDPKPDKKDIRERFSFDKARELLKDYKGSLSDAVIEERYED